jgi:hypothetical protein
VKKKPADAANAMGKSAGAKFASAARSMRKAVGQAAVHIGDLNGDGKIDYDDLKIAIAKTKGLASKVADEAGTLGKGVVKHEMVKDAAAGAAIGALAAIPLPFVGPAVGASLGAIAGVAKNLTRNEKARSKKRLPKK